MELPPMTDLERVLLELDKLPTKSQVFAVVAAARREGAEEMRERAAKTADYACIVVPPDGSSPTKDARLLCEEAAHRIRALPLTPEEPT